MTIGDGTNECGSFRCVRIPPQRAYTVYAGNPGFANSGWDDKLSIGQRGVEMAYCEITICEVLLMVSVL